VIPHEGGARRADADGIAGIGIPEDCRCTAVISPPQGADRVLVARLAHLYLCQRLSTYRIADVTGQDRQRVTRLLHKAGVPLRPRGAGRPRPHRRREDPPGLREMLGELYLRYRLNTVQIGVILGIPDRAVRDRLRRYGIRTRTRGGWDREDRRTVPAAVLRELYSRAGLTADEVGRKLGTSRKIVLRSAHDLGVPVRLGGPRHQPDFGEIELIHALYADGVVAAALIRHKIPRVPPGGSIWERFPEPVPLSRHLVEDLYWHCGVALNHVELLTGQPAHTVHGFMSRAGIAVRHPGGRSPFIRRSQKLGDRRPRAST
jgi:hypothetical protein